MAQLRASGLDSIRVSLNSARERYYHRYYKPKGYRFSDVKESLRVMKRQVYDSLLQSLDESIERANDEMIQSFQCDDFQEGVAHFMEQRPPNFTGK